MPACVGVEDSAGVGMDGTVFVGFVIAEEREGFGPAFVESAAFGRPRLVLIVVGPASLRVTKRSRSDRRFSCSTFVRARIAIASRR